MMTNRQITSIIRMLIDDCRYTYNRNRLHGRGIYRSGRYASNLALHFRVDYQFIRPMLFISTASGRFLTKGELREERDITAIFAQVMQEFESIQSMMFDDTFLEPDTDALRYQRRHPGGKKEKKYRNVNRFKRNEKRYRQADKFGTHYSLQMHDRLTLGKAPRIEIEEDIAPNQADNDSNERDLKVNCIEGVAHITAPKLARPARNDERHRRKQHNSFFAPIERRRESDEIRVSPAAMVELRYGRQKGTFNESHRKFIRLLFGRNDKRAVA